MTATQLLTHSLLHGVLRHPTSRHPTSCQRWPRVLVPLLGGSPCPLHRARNFPGEPHQHTPQPHILEKPSVFCKSLEQPAAPTCDPAFASCPRVPRKQAGARCAHSAASSRTTQRPAPRPAIWLAGAHAARFPPALLVRLVLTRNFRSRLPGSVRNAVRTVVRLPLTI